MPVISSLKLLIAFCTVHVLSCLLVKIFGHTTAIHVHCAAIKGSMPEHQCSVHFSLCVSILNYIDFKQSFELNFLSLSSKFNI